MTTYLRVIHRAILLFLLFAVFPAGPATAGEKFDLDKAIKVGTGKTMVIEFTDPDCPFCRTAAAYFRKRQDVTLYVFLKPIAKHPQAREKARFILSAVDRAKAYDEVMTGQWDDKPLTGITPAGTRLLNDHIAIAREEKINGLPTFLIASRIIVGFNQQMIEALLPR